MLNRHGRKENFMLLHLAKGQLDAIEKMIKAKRNPRLIIELFLAVIGAILKFFYCNFYDEILLQTLSRIDTLLNNPNLYKDHIITLENIKKNIQKRDIYILHKSIKTLDMIEAKFA
jgi:DNA-binding FrmR family transcriptional regulator